MDSKPGKTACEDMMVLRDSKKAAGSLDWSPGGIKGSLESHYNENLENQKMDTPFHPGVQLVLELFYIFI